MPTPTISTHDNLSFLLHRFQTEGVEPPESFWIEIRKHILRIARYTLGNCAPSDSLEDVASDVIHDICTRAVKPFRPERANLSTYLFHLTRTASNRAKRESLKLFPGLRVDLESEDGPNLGPDPTTDAADRTLLVKSLLEIGRRRFGQAYAKALAAMWDGHDQSEAAAIARLDRHKLHRLNLRFIQSLDVRDWAT